MYFAFKNADPISLVKQLKEVDYTWVCVSIIFGFFAIISRALRWVSLLNGFGYNVKRANSIYAVSIGYFTNIAIPRAGEITRCTSLNQTEKIPVDKLFGTIILERVIDFVFLFSLIAITFALKFELFLSFLNQLIDFKSIAYNNIILVFLSLISSSSLVIFFFVYSKYILLVKLYRKKDANP